MPLQPNLKDSPGRSGQKGGIAPPHTCDPDDLTVALYDRDFSPSGCGYFSVDEDFFNFLRPLHAKGDDAVSVPKIANADWQRKGVQIENGLVFIPNRLFIPIVL